MKSLLKPAVCPAREDLAAFHSGKLPVDALESISDHLADCQACLSVVASLADSGKEAIQLRRLLQTPLRDPYASDPDYLRMQEKIRNPFGEGQGTPTGKKDPVIAGMTAPFAWGKYQIIEYIGGGGMGDVFRGQHLQLNKEVAVKFLKPFHTVHPPSVARFQREMKALGPLDDPHIVRATDADELNGTHYLVMELVKGLDLSRLGKRIKTLPVADCCELVRQAAVGLQCVFEHRLVHRDIKPSNLYLSDKGVVKILDLGLAILARQEDASGELTLSDMVIGTADYMAPEQWTDCHHADIRADIYSLGCTLYKLLTGTAPFPSPEYRTQLQKQEAHQNRTPPSIQSLRPEVPPKLSAIVQRMLSKKPEDRYATPAEVIQALEPFCAGANLTELLKDARAKADPEEAIDAATLSTGKQRQSVTSKQTRPAGRRRRVLTWTAVAAGVLAVIGLGTALPWLIKHQDQGKIAPITATQREFKKIEWHDLLDRPPEEFYFKNRLEGQSKWEYEPTKKSVGIRSFGVGLLSLGKTDAQGYILEVDFMQPRWTGNFGVFFGGKQVGTPEDGALNYQLIWLNDVGGPDKKLLGLQRDRESILFSKGKQPAFGLVGVGSWERIDVMLGNPPLQTGSCTLRIVVTKKHGLSKVDFHGQPFKKMAEEAANKGFQPSDYEGEFGVVCRHGEVIITRAFFYPTEN